MLNAISFISLVPCNELRYIVKFHPFVVNIVCIVYCFCYQSISLGRPEENEYILLYILSYSPVIGLVIIVLSVLRSVHVTLGPIHL